MRDPQAFDIEPTSKQAPLKPFRSDVSCFSPLSDRKGIPPSCSRCGQEAIGGTFIDWDSGYPLGQVTGTAEFTCSCAGIKVYSISAANIDQWQLFKQTQPGIFRVKKRTQAERIKETNAGN